MKKEDRKMRNRAAAQLSRQRKKEETDKLKIEFDELNKKCERLENENKELKKRVHKLEQEVSVN
jgi:predicted  nucleic acid-binding Zn-ribbon protein